MDTKLQPFRGGSIYKNSRGEYYHFKNHKTSDTYLTITELVKFLKDNEMESNDTVSETKVRKTSSKRKRANRKSTKTEKPITEVSENVLREANS